MEWKRWRWSVADGGTEIEPLDVIEPEAMAAPALPEAEAMPAPVLPGGLRDALIRSVWTPDDLDALLDHISLFDGPGPGSAGGVRASARVTCLRKWGRGRCRHHRPQGIPR